MADNREKVATLAERLQEALRLRNMRASELSKITDVPKGAISYYLTGKSEPKTERLYILAVGLGVSEAWLLGYDVPMERTTAQKKNDRLAQLVVKMRSEPDFLAAVDKLADLTPEQYAIIKQLLTTF